MFYVYILRSKRDHDLYLGSTNDLRRRFEEHNKGKVYSTKLRTPFELIYYEAYKAEKDARERENIILNCALRHTVNLKAGYRVHCSLKKLNRCGGV